MLKRIFFWILIAGVLCSVLIMGCETNEKEIKIGVLAVLTGDFAYYGEWTKNGAIMAAEEINIQGAINGKKLKLIFEDHKNDPNLGVNAFMKLINIEKVPAVITITSGVVLAVAKIAEQNHIVQINTAALNPEIRSAGDYTFSIIPNADDEAIVLSNFLIKNLGIQKLAILHSSESYGVGAKNAFIKEFSSLGGKILGIESYNASDTDFRSQITKIKYLNPQGVYLAGSSKESGFILRQSKEIGFKSQWFSYAAFQGEDVLKIAKKEAEGVIYTYPSYDPSSSIEQIKDFTKKYREKFSITPEVYSATAYDAIRILSFVITKVGNKSEKIKEELYNLKNFPGVTGNISFDKDGCVTGSIILKAVENDQFVRIHEN